MDTYNGGDNFNQTEDEEDIAHCVKAPHPPFQHYPKHENNAADQDSVGSESMFLE